jgi:hypothetical protein
MIAKERFKKLCAVGEVSGPVSDELINSAQSELGVNFPEEYVEFLREFGAAIVSGAQVYGIPDHEKKNPPLWQNVVLLTRQLRDLKQAGTERANSFSLLRMMVPESISFLILVARLKSIFSLWDQVLRRLCLPASMTLSLIYLKERPLFKGYSC